MDIGNSMFICLFTCPAVKYIFYVKTGDDKLKCLDKCPSDKDYFVVETAENNYECRTTCPYDYPYYTKDTNGHNACSKINPCNGDTPYFMKVIVLNHIPRLLIHWLKEIFVLVYVIQQRDLNLKKKLKMEMLLISKNIVIIMNMLVEIIV
jgi:hypothetical protein